MNVSRDRSFGCMPISEAESLPAGARARSSPRLAGVPVTGIKIEPDQLNKPDSSRKFSRPARLGAMGRSFRPGELVNLTLFYSTLLSIDACRAGSLVL